MLRLILKMLFNVFWRRPMRVESSQVHQQSTADAEDNSSEAQRGSTSITSPYESLTSDQLVELYCSGLIWPAISEVAAVLERRGISYKEPTLLANRPDSDAAGALQYRPYEPVDLQDWPRAEAVYVGFDQAAADRLVESPKVPLPELSPD
jgi:hypothetical protein